MDRPGLRLSRRDALWKEGLEILDGITIDDSGDAKFHLERLVAEYVRTLEKHEKSGSLATAGKQLRDLATAADAMAAALGHLGLEARQSIFGGGLGADHAEIIQDGYLFEGGWLPSGEDFAELANACRNEADGYRSFLLQYGEMPHVQELLCITPEQMASAHKFWPLVNVSANRALVTSCADALHRVGRIEKLNVLVRIVASLATGKSHGARFAERECQGYYRAHNAQHT